MILLGLWWKALARKFGVMFSQSMSQPTPILTQAHIEFQEGESPILSYNS